MNNPSLQWKEQTDKSRYDVVRNSSRRIDPDKTIIKSLEPKGLLLRGPKIEVDALKKILLIDLTELKTKFTIYPHEGVFNVKVAL